MRDTGAKAGCGESLPKSMSCRVRLLTDVGLIPMSCGTLVSSLPSGSLSFPLYEMGMTKLIESP